MKLGVSKFAATLAICALLAACSSATAPVVNGWQQKNSAEISNYRVQPGDSLYSVAWAFGVDYRDLARYNGLSEPYTLTPGRILRMSRPVTTQTKPDAAETNSAVVASAAPAAATPIAVDHTPPAATTTAKSVASTTSTAKEAEAKPLPQNAGKASTTKTAEAATTEAAPAMASQKGWRWPTQGRVVRGFSKASGGNRGVDISGHIGQPIIATNSGKVVYTGASLPGYGNLIIIKHSDNELSAYAFNKLLMVKEGQTVTAGQAIAQMGQNDAGKAFLHFEIRQNGKPVDPMLYFKKS